MSLLALGMNHESASVEFREKAAIGAEQISHALSELHDNCHSQSVIVSTCNRTELYVHCNEDDPEPIIHWLANFQHLDEEQLRESLYVYRGSEVVRHLIRVAAGLDSMILGEPQIFGQVKQAYAEAREVGVIGPILERCFQRGFAAAKEVRTQTGIGESAVSVAYAAVSLAKQIFADISQAKVMLIGAGETIELVAKHLLEQGVTEITVANRTVTRAQELAKQFNGHAIALNELPDYLPQADIVIGSTASPLPIIGKGMMEQVMKTRRHQPVFMVDIAVPRDIESQVGDLRDIYLYTVDDLKGIIEQNLAHRREEADQAEALISRQVDEFMAWFRSLETVDSIRHFRVHCFEMRDEQVDKALESLSNGHPPEEVIQELAFKLTNKLIHAPTQALNKAGREGRFDHLEVIRQALGCPAKSRF
ncbi:glutamyl-tRNA reductase [Celerinatantimonas diazotrophica]|uniref:Glutamyl-tRNA reductase n=1 Tax=Celerinatantimonas diazotrophica TaxID=412034 RepID=A0A4R1JLR1_9GAMM|nr:glutamyl-tRNA reductase [Celerinatantimonas diazotrophica]TCK52005.1 glutamyl-tRNA reductase [Celerinatantimonas diazotrophica]CAG9296292.1 Glutamyl-tRNA reductase [Celerinatantimonas diazotrophica]